MRGKQQCWVASLVITGLLVLTIGAGTSESGTITIDDFSTPEPGGHFFSFDASTPSFLPKGRVLVKNAHANILGGERDILLDVQGNPSVLSAAGMVDTEAGLLRAATAGSSPTRFWLQYDGVDLLDTEDGGLVDAESIGGQDLTDGGANSGFLLSFASLDAGMPPAQTMAISVVAVGEGGTTTATAEVMESSGPTAVTMPFAGFSDPSIFDNVKSITFTFNDGPSAIGADFALDSITVVPEPSTLAMLAGLAACLFGLRIRRRR